MDKTTQEPASPCGWDLINDLSSLPENEDLIIDFLLERLQKGQIYTWVGALLLAVNPSDEKSFQHIYDSAHYQKYINPFDVISTDVAPHIFAITARAYYRVIQGLGKGSQMIVISGESGTGKTFNAHRALDFLVFLNNDDSTNLYKGDCVQNIVEKITSICPLICAFSTACAENNEKSSRHGQLVKLQYKDGMIRGATIHSFLLERSRVTRGTSNFQIFYQFLNGLDPEQLRILGLSRNEKYRILGSENSVKRGQYQEDFLSALRAMDALGFSLEQKQSVFEIIALIIHMGNIQFVENNECCIIDLMDKNSAEALRNVCTLTRLCQDDIEELLTTTLITAQSTWRRHTAYRRNLITINACQNRLYSIIRHVYDRLFHWLVDRVNKILSIEEQCTRWLGILDIFGFESFQINGMEQLCVNYANERLQQYFIEVYVEAGKKDLRDEGLMNEREKSSTVIHLYQDRLSVLEGALFATLNDASQSYIAPDITMIKKQAYEKSCKLNGKFLNETHEGFLVNHYAGPTEYTITDLLSKNTDKIPSELAITFGISENKFLRLLSNMDEEENSPKDRIFTRKGTTLAKLKCNLDTLIRELDNCDSHYVRCVKPRRLNLGMKNSWDRKEFRRQLMYTGIFDALPLARCKYPIRFSYQEFYKRYSTKPSGVRPFQMECQKILSSYSDAIESNSLVYYGNRFIFLKEAIFLDLEISRRKSRTLCVNKIQTFWLRHRRQKKVATITPSSLMQPSKNVNPSKKHTESLEYSMNLLEDDVFEENSSTATCILEESSFLDITPHIQISVEHQSLIEHDQPEEIHLQHKLSEYIVENECASCKKTANSNHFPASRYTGGGSNANDKIDVNCYENNRPHANIFINFRNKNNNLLGSHDQNFMNILRLSEKDQENCHVITNGSYLLFLKNKILSRRRLAEVPIRFHVRRTSLPESHRLPRSELPHGLQDCL